MNPYIQSRKRDFVNLTYEIAEAPKFAQGKDLGYCFLMGSTVYADDEIIVCKGREEALAVILKKFW